MSGLQVDSRDPVLDGLGLLQNPRRLLFKVFPRLSQPDASAGPVEEPDAELSLELHDLPAQGRLGDMQPLGCPPEVQLL